MTAQITAAHRAALDAVAQEGGGSVRARAVQISDLLGLLRSAAQGDHAAPLLTRAFQRNLDAVRHTHASGRRPYCASCGEAYTAAAMATFAFVAVLPDVERPRRAAILPVCAICAPTKEAFEAKGREVVDQLWPGAGIAIEPAIGGAA